MTEFRIRPGGEDDVPAVLALLDGAVAWLVARGRPGQWGVDPLSANPRRVALTWPGRPGRGGPGRSSSSGCGQRARATISAAIASAR